MPLKILGIIFFISILAQQAVSQILPAENSRLNYRIIGFSFPPLAQADSYKVEVAVGHFTNEDSFAQHIISQSAVSKINRVIGEVPYFGYRYTWRAVSADSAKVAKGSLHYFSTMFLPKLDTFETRLRILRQAEKYCDAYFFLDGYKVLYDINGAPVWFIPTTPQMLKENVAFRDIKCTPQGTITYLHDQDAYEINYNGDVLWKAPNNGKVSGDGEERYHHEFTRLSNGHYMVLGVEHAAWAGEAIPGYKNDSVEFGTIIEYDSKGRIVWSWKSSGYFKASDVVYYKPSLQLKTTDVHENAFFFDERAQIIYVSFKNLSRILKVKYPEGRVIRSYGETFRPGVPQQGNGLFCDQHACALTKKGYLLLYNNNGCSDSTSFPRITMLQEPVSEMDKIKKVWEYECILDTIDVNPAVNVDTAKAVEKKAVDKKVAGKKQTRNGHALKSTPLAVRGWIRTTTGGNVMELQDSDLFVCMNTQYSRLFIVSPEKKILWSAIPEKKYPERNEWHITQNQYRASLITRSDLEHLIWNEPLK